MKSLRRWLSERRAQWHREEPRRERDDSTGDEEAIPEALELPIAGDLDLHGFRPEDTRSVTDAYLAAASERGLREIRVVHGKGRGVQRAIIRSLLEHHPLVASFREAPPARGGFGATIVHLKERPAEEPETEP